jgi:polyphenol oxidase
MNLSFIVPQWPVPGNIVAGVSTRKNGVSQGAYASFNIAEHVLDNPLDVAQNREQFKKLLHLPGEPHWLTQVHGTKVVLLPQEQERVADAALTRAPNTVCVAMTADCLPLLICNKQGTEVAAVHAGWKGLALGVIEATIAKMHSKALDLLVWLGPAISQQHFEVGAEVLNTFVTLSKAHEKAFIAGDKSGVYRADLYLIARQKLAALGIAGVYGGDFCTYAQEDLFYSHRRDKGITGRMASLIYFTGTV